MLVAITYSVFATSDDGSHWTALYRGEHHELLALGCLGDEVFVGGRGIFLHSRDEGATWYNEELDSLYTSEMVGMYQAIGFGSKGEVYVGGEGSYNPATVGSLFRRAIPTARINRAWCCATSFPPAG